MTTQTRAFTAAGVAVAIAIISSAAGTSAASPPPARQAGHIVPAPAPAGVHRARTVNGVKTLFSFNWSGYGRAGSNHSFTAVEGLWKVPRVTARTNSRFAVDWVGIDGFGGPNRLVQCGTFSYRWRGHTRYGAWTEIIPAPSVRLSLRVGPGNEIRGQVLEVSSDRWRMTVRNLTTGKSAGVTVSYTTPGATAEAVHERPAVDGVLSQLARTSNVTFKPGFYSSAAVGSAPRWKALLRPAPGVSVGRIFMVNDLDTAVIASPSLPSAASNGFAVAYGSTPPPAP